MENQKYTQKSKPGPNWNCRGRGLANIFRMGHCAPAVMQTILDVSSTKMEWPVRLSAGMPGGIGNTGFECGGVTSPLMLLGIHYGMCQVDGGLPVIFDKGHTLCQHFLGCHKTLQCREIRGKDRFPRHCIGPVTRSPEFFLATINDSHQEGIPATRRAGYSRLYSHWIESDFHCAQSVLLHLGYTLTEHRELLNAASTFMGGTLFMGKTCSAFTAGVMAIGLRDGEIENSYLRVLRLLTIMAAGGNAFDERINKFNRSMNRGYRLSKWFAKEFGNTQCQAITQCDFSDLTGVSKYIEGNQVAKCKVIAAKVAENVQAILAKAEDLQEI